ncbi:hypothetical protein P3370_23740, partial [Vibrio parahaemolyticus]|nr:hypothetical protein [Vibrio parahaemolyticus]
QKVSAHIDTRRLFQFSRVSAHVEKFGQASCPELYTQSLRDSASAVSSRSALNKFLFFDFSCWLEVWLMPIGER